MRSGAMSIIVIGYGRTVSDTYQQKCCSSALSKIRTIVITQGPIVGTPPVFAGRYDFAKMILEKGIGTLNI